MASSSFFAKLIASFVISHIQASYLPDYPHPTTCATIDCKPNMICKMYNGVPECVPGSDCNFACTLELSPVCGSDGKTYSNACALKHAACESKKQITVASDGDCPQGCEAVTCMSPKVCREINGHGVCECPLGCPKNLKPVCGSDGVTYDNKCLLNAKACETNSQITVVRKGPCPIGCATIRCLPPRLCEEIDGHGKCVCPSACPAIFKPVCGSDGKTYSNDCFLGIAACKNKKHILVVSQGPCPQPTQAPNCDPIICASPNTCNHVDGQYKCICSRFCTLEFAPVCGSDGKTYPNKCGLRVAACNSNTRITIENEGPCAQGCEALTCMSPKVCREINGHGVCECPLGCPKNLKPVCGSDGVTYDNKCLLDAKACETNSQITVVRKGPCPIGCATIRCLPPRFCEEIDGHGKCVCPSACPAIFKPVCGSDGKTYSNDCFLGIAACKNKDISVVSQGPCPQPTQAPNCDPIICASPNTCNHVDGQYKCICSRFCTLEFAPVCGSDGKTYPNKCGLRVAACNSNTRITIENEGPCAPPKITCANVLCTIHTECKMINDKPVCVSTCPKFCLEIYSPVCGSDGVTYDNECKLKRAACKKGIIITVAHKGPCANPCDLSKSCRSPPYSTCRPVDGKPKCFCNRACPRIFAPVCGSDGKTYSNECKMEAASCKKNQKITVQRRGKCIPAYYKAG